VVLLVLYFERARNADLASGNFWVSFSSKVRARMAREFEPLFVDFFVERIFVPPPS